MRGILRPRKFWLILILFALLGGGYLWFKKGSRKIPFLPSPIIKNSSFEEDQVLLKDLSPPKAWKFIGPCSPGEGIDVETVSGSSEKASGKQSLKVRAEKGCGIAQEFSFSGKKPRQLSLQVRQDFGEVEAHLKDSTGKTRTSAIFTERGKFQTATFPLPITAGGKWLLEIVSSSTYSEFYLDDVLISEVPQTKVDESDLESWPNEPSPSAFISQPSSFLQKLWGKVSRIQPVMAQGSNGVRPVYFVPADMEIYSQYLEGINNGMATVRAWYAQQLDGRLFNLEATIVHHDLQNYDTIRCFGRPRLICQENRQDLEGYIPYVRTLYPARANHVDYVFAQGAGWAMISIGSAAGVGRVCFAGDCALAGLSGGFICPDCPRCCDGGGKQAQMCVFVGATYGIAHELGHAFGLGHPGAYDYLAPPYSVMSYGPFNLVTAVLYDAPEYSEKEFLRHSPFFGGQAPPPESPVIANIRPVSAVRGGMLEINAPYLSGLSFRLQCSQSQVLMTHPQLNLQPLSSEQILSWKPFSIEVKIPQWSVGGPLEVQVAPPNYGAFFQCPPSADPGVRSNQVLVQVFDPLTDPLQMRTSPHGGVDFQAQLKWKGDPLLGNFEDHLHLSLRHIASNRGIFSDTIPYAGSVGEYWVYTMLTSDQSRLRINEEYEWRICVRNYYEQKTYCKSDRFTLIDAPPRVLSPITLDFRPSDSVLRVHGDISDNTWLREIALWYRESKNQPTAYNTASPQEGWVKITSKTDCPQEDGEICSFDFQWNVPSELRNGQEYQFILAATDSDNIVTTGDIFRPSEANLYATDKLLARITFPSPAADEFPQVVESLSLDHDTETHLITFRAKLKDDNGLEDITLWYRRSKNGPTDYDATDPNIGWVKLQQKSDCPNLPNVICEFQHLWVAPEDSGNYQFVLVAKDLGGSSRGHFGTTGDIFLQDSGGWQKTPQLFFQLDFSGGGPSGRDSFPEVSAPLYYLYIRATGTVRLITEVRDDTQIKKMRLWYREARNTATDYGPTDPALGWVGIYTYNDCPEETCVLDYHWRLPESWDPARKYQIIVEAFDYGFDSAAGFHFGATGDIFHPSETSWYQTNNLLVEVQTKHENPPPEVSPCQGKPNNTVVVSEGQCYRCNNDQATTEGETVECRAARAEVCRQTADGGQARFERYDCACSGGLVTTCTALPQFGTCGACSSDAWGGCTPPEKCRLVNDEGLCQAASKHAPCCLVDNNCGGPGVSPECGYAAPGIYCGKCDHFQDWAPWCTGIRADCPNGAPAKPRLRSPTNAATVGEPSVTLSWYAFGEGLPLKCGEMLATNWNSWEDCNQHVYFNSPAQCLLETAALGATDRSCWGYVCAKGSMGIPSAWRYYSVRIKGPAESDFREICHLADIPNATADYRGWGGALPAEKVNCPFSPSQSGTYQWFVQAGYVVPTGYFSSTDSERASFTVNLPSPPDAFPAVRQGLSLEGEGRERRAVLVGEDDVAIEKVLVHFAAEGQSNWQEVVNVSCGQKSCSLNQAFALPENLAPGNYTFVASLWDHVIPAAGQHFGTTGANTFLSSDCTAVSTYCYSDRLRFNLAVQPPASASPQCTALTLDKTQAAPEDPVRVGVTAKSGSSNFKATSAITLVALRVSDNSTHGILTFSHCDGVDAKTTPCTDTTQGFTPAHGGIPQAGLYKFYVAMVNQEGKTCDDLPGTPVANQCGCGTKDLTVTAPPAPDAFPTVTQALHIEGSGKDFRATAAGEDDVTIEKVVVHYALEGQTDWREAVNVSCGQRQCSLNQAFTLPQALSPGRYKFIASLWDHTTPAAGQHFGTTGANFGNSDCSPTATYCHSDQLQFMVEVQPPAQTPPHCQAFNLNKSIAALTEQVSATFDVASGSSPFKVGYVNLHGATSEEMATGVQHGLGAASACNGKTTCQAGISFKPGPDHLVVGVNKIWLSLQNEQGLICTDRPGGYEGRPPCGCGVKEVIVTSP